MTEPPNPSPRAQAILRAIEHEAQARRERVGEARQQNAASDPVGGAAERLMQLVDHVVDQTESVRARVKEVERSLDTLARELEQADAFTPPVFEPEQAPEPEPEATPAPVPEQAAPEQAAPTPAPPPSAEAQQPQSDAARLMAIEMAVSGSSRAEVGGRLAGDFGVADPAPILDDVFGVGSADDSRMPWTS